jgi:hypothetical protein
LGFIDVAMNGVWSKKSLNLLAIRDDFPISFESLWPVACFNISIKSEATGLNSDHRKVNAKCEVVDVVGRDVSRNSFVRWWFADLFTFTVPWPNRLTIRLNLHFLLEESVRLHTMGPLSNEEVY